MENKFCVVNGNYLPIDNPVLKADNRAFEYADGLYETMRLVNGKVWNFKPHFDRLLAGMAKLKMEQPAYFTAEKILAHIHQLAEKNGIDKGGRAKLIVYRNSGGRIISSNEGISYLLKVEAVEHNLFQMNTTGSALYPYTDLKKPINFLSNFKLLHSEIFVLAGLTAKENGYNEAIIHNESGAMIETTSSNLFVVYPNQVIFTPGIESGCLAGTMRMHIINIALQYGYKIYESNITNEKLLEADEVFLTNAITGVQWVVRYKSKRYFHKTSTFLQERLNEKVLQEI